MIGWILFAGLALLTFAAIWAMARPGKAGLQVLGAALLVAAAGYAWQGHPGLMGHPVTPAQTKPKLDTVFADERKDWMYTVGRDAEVLSAADTLIAGGDADYAAGIIRGQLAHEPKSPMLWMGLGNALVHYSDGAVTPAARYAYERAAALSPADPAPYYFLGMAYAMSGDFAAAGKLWAQIVDKAPADAPWRAKVAFKLELLRRLRLTN